ncbi:MAG: LysM peptidoglycan-binding protein [Herminiimonas sp.]|nr:LysM peptidoglycan-binding protein [Herminiimonas sp.]
MKKFSTASRLFALGTAFAMLPAIAQTSTNASVATVPATSRTAATVHDGAGSAHCGFLPDAPDQHKVVPGDTLWGISGRFLQHPWCWPQVWGLNRDQISNPHWIYPGQIVVFDRAAGRLSLRGDGAGSEPGVVRLSPHTRAQNLPQQAIPAIPLNAIQPFLTRPLIVERNELASSPRIVAAADGHVFLGKGDKAYVRGDLKGGTEFQVYRPGEPLRDPDTKTIIGYEATYLGTLALDRAARADNEAHRFIVSGSTQEMGVGDRLVPIPAPTVVNYAPHPPSAVVRGRVMAIPGGVTQGGQNNVISINRGASAGIDVGTVLELYRYGRVIADRTEGRKLVQLPDEKYGTVFVFRVFDRVSYGLVMQVSDSVQIGDIVRSPE